MRPRPPGRAQCPLRGPSLYLRRGGAGEKIGEGKAERVDEGGGAGRGQEAAEEGFTVGMDLSVAVAEMLSVCCLG